jgi:hypothetical protein
MTLRIQATSYPRWMIVFASLLALGNPKIDSALGCEQQVQVFGHNGISRGTSRSSRWTIAASISDSCGFGANEIGPGAPYR